MIGNRVLCNGDVFNATSCTGSLRKIDRPSFPKHVMLSFLDPLYPLLDLLIIADRNSLFELFVIVDLFKAPGFAVIGDAPDLQKIFEDAVLVCQCSPHTLTDTFIYI